MNNIDPVRVNNIVLTLELINNTPSCYLASEQHPIVSGSEVTAPYRLSLSERIRLEQKGIVPEAGAEIFD